MAGNSANVNEMREAGALMVDAGLDVYEVSGWTSRGRSSDLYPWALIAHHTAATTDITEMLCNGRSDLPGPLCNFELQKSGRWGLLASGRANHAGEATITNSESYGIEATGPIPLDAYGPGAFPNYDSYEVGCACILAAMGTTVDDLKGHKEIAQPPGRKIDPSFDMGTFRKSVAAGGGMEDDLSAEAERQIKAIYDAMVVPGSTDPSEPYEKHYNLLKSVNTALSASGTTGPEQTIEYIFGRLRAVEDGIKALCDAQGIPFTEYSPPAAE
jgi:hypothetical protein